MKETQDTVVTGTTPHHARTALPTLCSGLLSTSTTPTTTLQPNTKPQQKSSTNYHNGCHRWSTPKPKIHLKQNNNQTSSLFLFGYMREVGTSLLYFIFQKIVNICKFLFSFISLFKLHYFNNDGDDDDSNNKKYIRDR